MRNDRPTSRFIGSPTFSTPIVNRSTSAAVCYREKYSGKREDPSGTRTSVLRSRSGCSADYVFVRSADIKKKKKKKTISPRILPVEQLSSLRHFGDLSNAGTLAGATVMAAIGYSSKRERIICGERFFELPLGEERYYRRTRCSRLSTRFLMKNSSDIK